MGRVTAAGGARTPLGSVPRKQECGQPREIAFSMVSTSAQRSVPYPIYLKMALIKEIETPTISNIGRKNPASLFIVYLAGAHGYNVTDSSVCVTLLLWRICNNGRACAFYLRGETRKQNNSCCRAMSTLLYWCRRLRRRSSHRQGGAKILSAKSYRFTFLS